MSIRKMNEAIERAKNVIGTIYTVTICVHVHRVGI